MAKVRRDAGCGNPKKLVFCPWRATNLFAAAVSTQLIKTLYPHKLVLSCDGFHRVPAGRETLRDVSLVVLYPGIFLLIFGTFLGAVWANISWGSYWAWDPKETWALITILVYSFALHGGSLKIFRNPTFFHIYAILAFLSVLVTYFGVNLILGGMHAYA